jgi:hypothetical protein
MTQEPSIFHRYGLGADVSGTDPLGAFELHLVPTPSQVTPSSNSTPTLPPRLYNNQTQVTVVEVKNLRQTVAIEIRYRDTNACMEWIKYSIHTLNKSNCYVCTTGRPESLFIRMVLGPRWNVLHVGSVSGCQGLRQQILPDTITSVKRSQRSCRSAHQDY